MTVNIEEATQVGNYFVQHLPRNPSMFSGEDGEDPLTWLKGYKRVAKHNHWDETLCLANVYFYLNGTALKWFENNEETFRNLEEFTTQLESVFGKKRQLPEESLTASQTRFGWTLMGECLPGIDVSLAHHVTTVTISESSIPILWNLDVLGIIDPIEVKQRDQRDALARRHFLKTVQHSVSGRYLASLPWTHCRES
ncbi:hypothetical protein LAZ67_18000548 [Cordylochernes scorpioides]|uniref:Retrotransposon gag domain-containing protein n=1 Tax=Cordylochernes scorpioides TaxID=51811 RepID=A0ABY6LH34_9ARAC|nr:hypothetical protein LAZ67_18000548 [Cordylochernes scorpioides]